MKNKEAKRKIMTLIKFKPNPNHYIIIDKWNRREYNKVKIKIFDAIEEEINNMITQNWVENFVKFASFPSTIGEPIDFNFWELYKNNLPLWSNINPNCYIEYKEKNIWD